MTTTTACQTTFDLPRAGTMLERDEPPPARQLPRHDFLCACFGPLAPDRETAPRDRPEMGHRRRRYRTGDLP